jgi:xanthine dehydrogenase accessory factor
VAGGAAELPAATGGRFRRSLRLGRARSTLGWSGRRREAQVREVLGDLLAARERGEAVALATVVRTWRSAPRPAGASLVVTAAGEAVGSVSGGCVEGALYDVATDVLGDGVARFEHYGVSDDDAFAVGLTCGGIIEVFVERVDEAAWPELPELAERLAAHQPVAVATVFRGLRGVGRHLVVTPDGVKGSLGDGYLDHVVSDEARGMLESGVSGVIAVGSDGRRFAEEVEVFVASHAPPPRLIIFGAIDFAAALCRVGKQLGFRVSVVDARPVFTTVRRFPDADEVVVDWPHRWLAGQEVDSRTVICVLTHDPKFDVPALTVALRTDAGYVGAMGSRRTHADRLERLREEGLTEAELARLRSPIGLDLGARTPDETAISIAAEIIRDRWGGSGERLMVTDGPIHPGAPR